MWLKLNLLHRDQQEALKKERGLRNLRSSEVRDI